MPWTSSWGKNAEWTAPVFEAIGRALYAAQEFENRCRVLLRFLNLVEIYESATDDPIDSLIARVPRDKLLGKTIDDLKRHRVFNSEDTAKLLKAAKDARNFIAHESAQFNPVGHRQDFMERMERELRPKLRELAIGHHIVSELLLRFEDRESAFGISWIKERYPDILESWVLYPVNELIRSEGMPPLAYPVDDPWYAARRAADMAIAAKYQAEGNQK
ncbi:hypothetical protein [Paenarthrobacter sp. YIM B13468]|uniref:hypothetical protein n=1 Tax=Paenarthrobacter sp. YIM B13468 TaxID=3366295 RepID=UPI00366ABBDC